MTDHTLSEKEELQLIDRLIKDTHVPESVVVYEIIVDEDSSGEPAFRIVLKVDDQAVVSNRNKLNEVRGFMSSVQRSALEQGLTRWPYFEFVNSR